MDWNKLSLTAPLPSCWPRLLPAGWLHAQLFGILGMRLTENWWATGIRKPQPVPGRWGPVSRAFMQPGSSPAQTSAETTFLGLLQRPDLPSLSCQLNYITSCSRRCALGPRSRFYIQLFFLRNVTALGKSVLFDWTRVRSYYLTRGLLLRYFILHRGFFFSETEMVIPNGPCDNIRRVPSTLPNNSGVVSLYLLNSYPKAGLTQSLSQGFCF